MKSKFSRFFPEPHPTRKIFRRHKITIAAVARFIGRSTSYTCQLLSGYNPASPELDAKLYEFARRVNEVANAE